MLVDSARPAVSTACVVLLLTCPLSTTHAGESVNIFSDCEVGLVLSVEPALPLGVRANVGRSLFLASAGVLGIGVPLAALMVLGDAKFESRRVASIKAAGGLHRAESRENLNGKGDSGGKNGVLLPKLLGFTHLLSGGKLRAPGMRVARGVAGVAVAVGVGYLLVTAAWFAGPYVRYAISGYRDLHFECIVCDESAIENIDVGATELTFSVRLEYELGNPNWFGATVDTLFAQAFYGNSPIAMYKNPEPVVVKSKSRFDQQFVLEMFPGHEDTVGMPVDYLGDGFDLRIEAFIDVTIEEGSVFISERVKIEDIIRIES